MINSQEKTTMTHVPYRGAGPATADVIAGQIQSSSDSRIPMVPQIKSGTVRAIGITGKHSRPPCKHTASVL
jgi:tripartite-type tricarboxylate transporter receptor subunit TctC